MISWARSVILFHQPDKLLIAHGFASHRLTDGGKHLRAVHVAQPLLTIICQKVGECRDCRRCSVPVNRRRYSFPTVCTDDVKKSIRSGSASAFFSSLMVCMPF